MKLLLLLSALLVACYADVGEKGYQYIPPSIHYQPTNGGRPSVPLGDELPQAGVGAGVHTPQETHGFQQGVQGSHGVQESHDVQGSHGIQGSHGVHGSEYGERPQGSNPQVPLFDSHVPPAQRPRPQVPQHHVPPRPQVPHVDSHVPTAQRPRPQQPQHHVPPRPQVPHVDSHVPTAQRPRPQVPQHHVPPRPQVPHVDSHVPTAQRPRPQQPQHHVPSRPQVPQHDIPQRPQTFPEGPLIIRPQAPSTPFGGFPQEPSRPQGPGFVDVSGDLGGFNGIDGVSNVGGTNFVSGLSDEQVGPVHTGELSTNDGSYVGGDLSAIPGELGIDYPNYDTFPQTSFSCNAQQFPGYYADVETNCQGFHICHDKYTYNFLCPLGTIFHQGYFVCVWWNQFDCSTAQSLYHLNENIYLTPPSTEAPLPGTSGGIGSFGSSGSVGSGVAGGFGTRPGGTGTSGGFSGNGASGGFGTRPGGLPSRPQAPTGSRPSQGGHDSFSQDLRPSRPAQTSPVRPSPFPTRPLRPGQQSDPVSQPTFPTSPDQFNQQGIYPSNQQHGNYPSNLQQGNHPSNQAGHLGGEVSNLGYPSTALGQEQEGGHQQYPGEVSEPHPVDASLTRPTQQADPPSQGYLPPTAY